MRATITNNSPAAQGVYTDDGLVFIEPGASETLTIREDYVERAKSLSYLSLVDPDAAAEPGKPRIWLATADDAGGAGFTPLDLGGKAFVGMAFAPERPADAEAYRFEATVQPDWAAPASFGDDDGDDASADAADSNPLDHDNDGKPGGSEPYDPPALKGKNKEALLEIAAAEGVEVPEGASNSTITKAIEAKRAAAAAE